MTNNTGWMQRVFGAKQPEDQPQTGRDDLAEQLRVRAELLLEVERWRGAAESAVGELELARTRANASDSALQAANAQIEALQTNLTESAAKLEEQAGALRAERERADALGKSATAANRRADKRLTEADASKKKLAELESRLEAVTDERVALELNLAALKGELDLARQESALSREDVVRSREQLAAREDEGARWRTRASAAEEELGSKADAERERERQLADLGRQNAEQRESLRVAEAETRRRGAALLDILRASARALETACGNGLPLALELAHLRQPMVALPTVKVVAAAARSVAQLLQTLKLADAFEVDEQGAKEFRCRLALSSDLATEDVSPFGCWVAAYATAALSSALDRKLCLEAFAGGPRDFSFRVTERNG
jgi:golgin subfamily B member 1